jgi:uncharacterized protein
MIIEIVNIPADGLTCAGEVSCGALDLPEDSAAKVAGPIHYALRAALVSGGLVVTGQIWANASLRCSRCGEFFPRRLDEPSFLCSREQVAPGESVDLTEDIREAILLAFPNHPVCSGSCLGLCFRCGKNLNRGTCTCSPPVDDRWAALNGLDGGTADRRWDGGGGSSPSARCRAKGRGRQH